MDLEFFIQRLFTIAKYQHSFLAVEMERKYYQCYIKSLASYIEFKLRGSNKNVFRVQRIIYQFEIKEALKVKNSFFCKKRTILNRACCDALDVAESMKRYEGVEGKF